jgi:hypothetical protein
MSKKYEQCIDCGEETGKAGKDDDSNYARGEGPFCDSCMQDRWEETHARDAIEDVR